MLHPANGGAGVHSLMSSRLCFYLVLAWCGFRLVCTFALLIVRVLYNAIACAILAYSCKNNDYHTAYVYIIGGVVTSIIASIPPPSLLVVLACACLLAIKE